MAHDAPVLRDPLLDQDPWARWSQHKTSTAHRRPRPGQPCPHREKQVANDKPASQMALDMLTAIVTASASRQVVAAAVSALWRLENADTSEMDNQIDKLVGSRLDALRPVLAAQTLEGLTTGLPQHGPPDYVSTSLRLRANAARHVGFEGGRTLSEISNREIRALQRGRNHEPKCENFLMDAPHVPSETRTLDVDPGMATPIPAPVTAREVDISSHSHCIVSSETLLNKLMGIEERLTDLVFAIGRCPIIGDAAQPVESLDGPPLNGRDESIAELYEQQRISVTSSEHNSVEGAGSHFRQPYFALPSVGPLLRPLPPALLARREAAAFSDAVESAFEKLLSENNRVLAAELASTLARA